MVKAFIFLASKSGPLPYHIKEVMLHSLAGRGTAKIVIWGNYFCAFLSEIVGEETERYNASSSFRASVADGRFAGLSMSLMPSESACSTNFHTSRPKSC